MASPDRLGIGSNRAVLGVAAVLLSIVGLQLGWLATELLGDRDALAVWVGCLCAVAAGIAGALGFWLGANRRIGRW